MTQRIPHPGSPTEVRQAFQALTDVTDVIDTGASDYILVGQGIGVAPVWQVLSSAIDHGGLGGLAGDDHTQYHNNTRGDARYYTRTLLNAGQLDTIYFQESEFLNSSAGAGDAGKPVKLDAGGHIDATMINDADIDHGTVGGLAGDDHAQYHNDTRGDVRYYTKTLLNAGQLDTLYFGEDEYLASSAGAGDAGKPVVLDAAGHIDATMLNDGDVDHGSIGGLEGDDHTIYSLADGTRDFSGVVVGVNPTSATHLATKEYVDQVINFQYRYYFNDTTSDPADYYKAETEPTGDGSSDFTTADLGEGAAQALTGWATDAGEPGAELLEHGIYSMHIHAAVSGTKPTRIFFRLYKRILAGAETLIATSEYSDYITTGVGVDIHATLASDTAILVTDRLVWKLLANVEATGNNVDVTLYAEGDSSTHVDLPTSREVLSTIFLRQDGTKDLIGNLSVTAEITIDGRDLSVDGSKLDGIEATADITDATNVAAAGAAMSGGAFHDGFSDVGTDNHHAQSHNAASHSDIAESGAAIDAAVAASHAESHNIASHSDTTATGTELETLTDNSIANTLHRHSELVASDGAPDPALSVDADGAITVGGSLGVTGNITGPNVTTGANPGHTHTGGVSGVDTVTELENNGTMNGAICHVVYSDGDGTFDFIDVSDADKSNAIGLLAQAIVMGATGYVRVGGVLSAAAGFWVAVGSGVGGLTPGAFYYASTTNAGWITDTRPTDPAYKIVRLGIALSTTDLAIDIQEAAPVLELLDTAATIYVDTAGSDATGLGTVGAPFATLGKAFSSLSTRVIASDVTITIQLGDGTYTSTSASGITHPNGDRISILGENVHSINLTSIQSSGGGVGAWAVVINVSDVSDAEVGDFLLVPATVTGGTRPLSFAGCWKITNVDVPNTRLTVTSTSRYTAAPAGAVASTVKIVKTILQYNGCHGFEFAAGVNLGNVDKLVISGNDTALKYGIYLKALSSCTAESGNIGIVEWARGTQVDFMSALKANSIIVSGCAQGIVTVAGTVDVKTSVMSGCSIEGIRCVQGSVSGLGMVISGNQEGADVQIQSSLTAHGGQVCYNIAIGLKASYNSFIWAYTLTFTTNGTNASPVVNTAGGVESYIGWS